MAVRGAPFQFNLRELGGACGDLGTLLPLLLGAVAVAAMPPMPVLLGFAAFYIATGLYYRLPIPVQPMKAMAAVALSAQLGAPALALAGVMTGAILILLSLTGLIAKFARLVPQSVLTGLQLGLGLVLGLVAVRLMATAPVAAGCILAVTAGLMLFEGVPAALVAIAFALVLGQTAGLPGIDIAAQAAKGFALPGMPGFADIGASITQLVLPQLALTLTNAIVLTALIAVDYFGSQAAHVTPARLSLTSGIANMLLAPFGALPMCHGAGGLAAHYRFGARSGTAPIMLGLFLAALALLPDNAAITLLAAIPAAGLGAMLFIASCELAMSRRLFDARPSCWPVIAIAAAATVWRDPFAGLVAGSLAEVLRSYLLRQIERRATGSRS